MRQLLALVGQNGVGELRNWKRWKPVKEAKDEATVAVVNKSRIHLLATAGRNGVG
jgi:hypothetical protein